MTGRITLMLCAMGLGTWPIGARADLLATSATYDEAVCQANAVGAEAGSSNITLARLRTVVRRARAENRGGVVHFDDFRREHAGSPASPMELPDGRQLAFGLLDSREIAADLGYDHVLTFIDPLEDSRLAVGHFTTVEGQPADRPAISASNGQANILLKAREITGEGDNDFAFRFRSDDEVTHVGFTLLRHHRQPYAVDVMIRHSDGSAYLFATETIRSSGGAGGGTFFGYEAPTGTFIVGLLIAIPDDRDGGLDDLAVVTTGRRHRTSGHVLLDDILDHEVPDGEGGLPGYVLMPVQPGRGAASPLTDVPGGAVMSGGEPPPHDVNAPPTDSAPGPPLSSEPPTRDEPTRPDHPTPTPDAATLALLSLGTLIGRRPRRRPPH